MVITNISGCNLEFYLFVKRAILTTRNEFVHEINDILINRFLGEETTYFSCDESTGICVVPNQQKLFHSDSSKASSSQIGFKNKCNNHFAEKY